jgi:nucleoside-diphosphate-sugar epimerase
MSAGRFDVVLLGATGFVGSAVVRVLASVDVDRLRIHALVRDPARLSPVPPGLELRVVRGDVRQPPPELFPSDPHVVIHLATKQIDVDGTGFEINLEAARALMDRLPKSARGILYGSSASVYGQSAHVDLDESAPAKPDTALARSRVAVESVLIEAARTRRISAYCLRPRLIFGAGDRYTLPGLVKMVKSRVQPGSGDQAYTVLDVDDYARMFVALSCRAWDSGAVEQESLNAGYARGVRLNEIVAIIRKQFELPPPRLGVPVTTWLARSLRIAPIHAADALATRLELFGLPHVYSVSNLRRKIGGNIVDRNPLEPLESAVAALRAGRSGC